MNDVPPVAPAASPQHVEAPSGSPAGSRRSRGLRRQRQKGVLAPDWWRKRNVLGVLNWELVLIVVVALVAGMAATVVSSIVGVR
jgi:hypothetical protein